MALSQLSEETKQIIKDNGFTLDMIQSFCPDDINEFQNMKDRFILRQIVKAGSIAGCVAPDTNIAEHQYHDHTTTTDIDLDITSSSQSNDETVKLDMSSASFMDMSLGSMDQSLGSMNMSFGAISNDFTSEQLLEKKRSNSQSTTAQSFFSNLIKDAAKEANIWKKSPLLSEISTSKRVTFLDGIKRAAPQLSSIKYQAQVWKRLGQCLQNRRKYLNDLLTGKRSPRMSSSTPNKMSKKSKTTSHPQVINNDREDSNMNVFVAGSNVVLLDRQNRAVAKAIVVGTKDKMFTEVVIQNLLVDDNDTDENLELPQVCGHYTKLCKGVIKKLVVWKTERIKPAAIARGNQKKKPHQPPTVGDEKKKNVSACAATGKSNHVKPHQPLCARVGAEKKKNASAATGKTNQVKSHHPLCVKKKTKTTCSTISDDSWAFRLAVFEWGNGELYIGYQKTKQSNSVIINCQKPLANIRDGKLVLPKEIESSMIKLNPHDTQNNPDGDYCVFKSAHYQLDSLCNMFVIADEQVFFYCLCDGFAEYMKKD